MIRSLVLFGIKLYQRIYYKCFGSTSFMCNCGTQEIIRVDMCSKCKMYLCEMNCCEKCTIIFCECQNKVFN